MKKLLSEKGILFSMFAVSIFLSAAILNRWVATDLKEKSFGRIWQYYVSWNDFGFFRRGLLGTLLNESGLNKLFSNEYLFSYTFYAALLLILYYLIYKIINSINLSSDGLLIAFVTLFSPAIFSHYAYSTGSNDLLLFVLFVTSVFFVSNVWLFSAIIASGVLVHELFIFMLPIAIAMRHHFMNGCSKDKTIDAAISTLASIATVFLVFVFGKPIIPMDLFIQTMADRMPNAAFQHSLWSGYGEIFGIEYTPEKQGINFEAFYNNFGRILLPTIYAVIAAFGAVITLRTNLYIRIIFFIFLLFPLAAQIVAGDYYRWVSVSAGISILVILFSYTKNGILTNKFVLYFLAAFVFLQPFGGAVLERPFPMHQFILEKTR